MRNLPTVLFLLVACLFSSTGFAQITGSSTVCVGRVDSLHGLPVGGTWSSSNAAVATVNAVGVVTGVSAGTAAISYSLWPTPMIVTVNAAPAAISSPGIVTCGSTVTLTDATPGGTWSSSAPSVVTISSAGVVTPMSYGAALITYTTPAGCYTTSSIWVSAATYPSVSGASVVCVGGTATLSGTPTGGTWSGSGSGISTVSTSTGVVTGVMPGGDSVTYTLTTGCGPVTAVYPITVTATATAGIIYGTTSIYCGGTTTLSSSAGTGSWSSSNPSVATIDPTTGVVTAVSGGTSIITFTKTSSCGTASTTATVNVLSGIGPITGDYSIACGATGTLHVGASGGTWSSSDPSVATISSTTGVMTGVSAGTVGMVYTMSTSCFSGTAIRICTVTGTSAGTISGPSSVCVGSTISMTASAPGGTWSTTSTVISVSSTGVVTGLSAGVDTVTYTVSSSCGSSMAYKLITVSGGGTTGALIGPATVFCGSSATFTCSPGGGTWSSSTPSVATISSGGWASGVSPGTTTISYTLSTSCGTATTTAVLTVSSSAITVATAPIYCTPNLVGMPTGASSYVWTPAAGLSCTACTNPYINPTVTTTYTVTGTGGCSSSSATVTVNANRILGHVTFSGTTPSSPTLKVWLIQFNPTDSSIIASDSTTTCTDSTFPGQYYQFNGKPAGNYLVKAKLLSSVAGSSGYIPTYGASTPNWFAATNISHTATTTNVQDINMLYGTVPAGPGFISGYVYAGAGKGTSTGVPNMLIYLKSATTGQVLTYTYTNASGAYSFSGLATGGYIIYPEDYNYYTTPSSVINLTSSASSATGIIFRQYATSKTIVPSGPTITGSVTGNSAVMIHPNPTSGVINIGWQNQVAGSGVIVVTDMIGREVYRTALNINNASGEQPVNLEGLNAGMYIISVNSESISYTGKLLLNK